ncbi:hypothetical protein VSDG_05613 [Cytospora chrysosperma]|uniref:Uncharacterized protein n=1 Tax=Cytospora chrysosperma TaxID=252740 RepID=A0A423W0B5_CYTCH|nr:hypothetical protein VSDG_05613 [Valsa sordida]
MGTVRNSPFMRQSSPSPSPGPPPGNARPKSALFPSPLSPTPSSGAPTIPSHVRAKSSVSSLAPSTSEARFGHARTASKADTSQSSTFAPSFIKSEEMRRGSDVVDGIEGENDFSGKRYVWLKDPQTAFVKGWVVEDLGENRILVQCDDGSQREVDAESVDKVNPAKFDKANDMAELTHLNEASVVHNLHMRYQSDFIYTYSGLFLVTVNPYCPLPIYTSEYVNMYKGRHREDNKPHIFAMADEAFRNLVEEGQNQSILVTGESGAGKTENTKKVIQYLAAVANSESSNRNRGQHSSLSAQILRANPILEAFGNAQTVRNNNSSRFGKFIRIEFGRNGSISGAFIDWYLLEKSRVVRINANERNYHIFYQLLKGGDKELKEEFLLNGLDVDDFAYTRDGQDTIAGVSDRDEWDALMEAFSVMGFSEKEQGSILRTVAAVLHLGNITVVNESRTTDQARLASDAKQVAERVCKLMGIPLEPFLQGLLHPKVKAGREWVEKVQTPEQVRLGIDALAKGIYERGFGDLVTRINRQLDRTGMGMDDSHFIGVLDIAGFEIFEENSFEQLCINYTNEKLQQFFNHHMFVLEQEEYAREQIEWKFIDFGCDLQPTIDLIELSNPIGIFSCLDEDCVMPKATDKSFTEKLHSLWDKKTNKYRASRLRHGFVLTHYAAEVEYSTEGWLQKNKDPLNDNVTRLLAASTDKHIANLFADCADNDDEAVAVRSRVKKGLFRTVAQRHKEQLSSLMAQLHSTHPHFVRCILPNHKKRPKLFNNLLVLDQLRCNGVLEGIRIARTGFPNRLPFAEFRMRYEVLCQDLPKGYIDGQAAVTMMLQRFKMDRSLYRVGLTKVFFRAGVLAELEEQRDKLISEIVARFQCVARGFTARRIAYKRLYRTEATRVIQQNFRVYLDLCKNPWWQLLVKMKPLLGATRTATEVKKRDELIRQLNDKMRQELADRQKLEEDRRNVHVEMMRVQQTLESERALALDKEEIFKRLQQREAELEDKLAGAIDDAEKLEDELDDLLEAKKRAEDDVDKFRSQLEQAASLIGRLEEEKTGLASRVLDLEAAIKEMSKKQSERSEQEAALEEEIGILQSQLALKDRKTRDLEGKLLEVDQDAEVKLHAAQKELQSYKSKQQQLMAENRDVQQQLSVLSKTSTDYEDLVRKKESELSLLRGDNKKYEMERKVFEDQRKTLVAEKDKAIFRMREVQAQLDALKSQQSQFQREAEDAKKVLEARLSEDAQADEHRQVLERQIKDLKDELYNAQMELKKTADILSFNNRMDLKAEVEELQNQLQIAQMQNVHLQSQLERSAPTSDDYSEEGQSLKRVKKLEKVNSRLHHLLDDSSKKVSALDKALRTGELSLHDIQTRSHEEILDLLNSTEESRRSLLHSHKDAVAELTDVKEHFDRMRHERAKLEVDLRDARGDLEEMTQAREQEAASRNQLLQEFSDLQIRLDAETSKLADVAATLSLYKGRADEYFSKLEQAEIAVLKASRAEQFAKSQAKEAEETYAEVMSERKKMDRTVEDLQRQNQRLEEKAEDLSTDLEAAIQAKKRLQHELEDYRNQRANDIEDTESSMEQTRKKYQAEFATLTKELDLAREEKLFKQAEITRLRDELDDLRSKWDDEVLNSSTWSKEKARLEGTLADVSASRDEAVNAHNEAQGKIVNLLSQVRTLRSSVDEVTAERDALFREKRSVEARLEEAKAGLEDLVKSESPSLRNAASIDKQMLELKSSLAQQEDIAAAAVEKMRRAEALASEVQKDIVVERETSAQLQKDKATLEKTLNEVQVKLVDLETKGYSSASQDIKFLHKRIQEACTPFTSSQITPATQTRNEPNIQQLETQLETQENDRAKSQRSVRNVDRTVKDLQSQIDRKDKQNTQMQEDLGRMRDKADKLLKTIDELQASESSNQLQTRRAERELREEREKVARLERELDSWKTLRSEKGSVAGSVAGSVIGGRGGMARTGTLATLRSSGLASVMDDDMDAEGHVSIPKRKSSISRVPSLTKGFL